VRAVLPAISASLSFAVAWFAPPVLAFGSVSISLALLILGQLTWRMLDEP